MVTSHIVDPWIASHKSNCRARLRLFCFPFAGGGASLYGAWQRNLPPEVQVCPVQLPGRENRFSEPPFTRIGPLIDALCHALGPHLDLPFVVFGHSMGAIVGYETVLRLHAIWGQSPVHLIISSRQAPHISPKDEPSYTLPDKAFIEKLSRLNGTPQEVLHNPELMDLLLPLVRADFELNETYTSSVGQTLDCPVTAFGSLDDKEVDRDHLAAWRETTRGPFQMHIFPGDHFFIMKRSEMVIAAVENILSTHL